RVGDDGTLIAALGDVAGVAEAVHQLHSGAMASSQGGNSADPTPARRACKRRSQIRRTAPRGRTLSTKGINVLTGPPRRRTTGGKARVRARRSRSTGTPTLRTLNGRTRAAPRALR